MGFVASLCPEGALSIAATAATSARATSFSGASTYTRSQSISAPVSATPTPLQLVDPSPPANVSPARTPAVSSSPSIPDSEVTGRSAAKRISTTTSFNQTYNSLLRASPAPTTNLRSGTASVYLPDESEFFGSAYTPSPPPSNAAHSELSYGATPAAEVPTAGLSSQRTLSAQEEKAQAFSQAKSAVARSQIGLPQDGISLEISANHASRSLEGFTAAKEAPAYESAAAEKKRLFDQLQGKISTNGLSSQAAHTAGPSHSEKNSPLDSSLNQPLLANRPTTSAPTFESAAAEKARLFKVAQERAAAPKFVEKSAIVECSATDAPPTAGVATAVRPPVFETAADEKARLFREAQGRAAGESSLGNVTSVIQGPVDNSRPQSRSPFPAHESATEEKARLRRQFEAAQAAVASRHGQLHPSASSSSSFHSSKPSVATTAPLSIHKATIAAKPPVSTADAVLPYVVSDAGISAPSDASLDSMVPHLSIHGSRTLVTHPPVTPRSSIEAAKQMLTEKVRKDEQRLLLRLDADQACLLFDPSGATKALLRRPGGRRSIRTRLRRQQLICVGLDAFAYLCPCYGYHSSLRFQR